MKDAGALPSVMLFGGRAEERASLGRALTGRVDCLYAENDGAVQRLMRDHFVQVAICAAPALSDPDLFVPWPETQIVCVGSDALPVDWSAAQLCATVDTALQVFRLKRDNDRMALELRCLGTRHIPSSTNRASLGFEGVLRAPGSPMAGVVQTARQFASFDVPVLLRGAPGTGKAEMAQAIHDSSLRSDQPFHSFDATGLSEDTITRALFGARRTVPGSAPASRPGLLRKTNQGTLYLAGLEALTPRVQARLLRVARDGVYDVPGSAETVTSQTRLITATACDPRALVAEGQLDPALFFEISIAELTLPALADRRGDIPLLAQTALEDACRLHGKTARGFSDAALEFLITYAWPGNLSELRNEVTRMLILAQEPLLGPEVISRQILQASPACVDHDEAQIMSATGPLKERIEAIEGRILRETLTRLKWNKSRAAVELGLSRVGLRAKIDRYGITQPQPEGA